MPNDHASRTLRDTLALLCRRVGHPSGTPGRDPLPIRRRHAATPIHEARPHRHYRR